jgi:glycosyltransferase involved in cell wall biosynthesis
VNVLLADPELRARMARHARQRVEERFSWTSVAQQTLEFYTDTIARHTAPRGSDRRTQRGARNLA